MPISWPNSRVSRSGYERSDSESTRLRFELGEVHLDVALALNSPRLTGGVPLHQLIKPTILRRDDSEVLRMVGAS